MKKLWQLISQQHIRTVPGFKKLSYIDIETHLGKKDLLVCKSDMMWTPRFYPVTTLSQEFISRTRKYHALTQWNDQHVLSFVELFVIEAIRDTTYQYKIAYIAHPMEHFPFHGVVDFLIYNNNKATNYFPFIPILLPTINTYTYLGDSYEDMSIAGMYGCCKWFLEMSKVNNTNMKYIRCIQTNGHIWSLNEVSAEGMKKTKPIIPNCRYSLDKPSNLIINDEEKMKSVIGLLRYGMQIQENIVKLTES